MLLPPTIRMIVRFTLLIILHAGLSGFLLAQETGVVTGRVLLDTDEPAMGANVLLVDTRLGAAVDESGLYVISGIPAGEYALLVRLIGYAQTTQREVRVLGGDTVRVNMTLAQDAIELGDVVITGSRRLEARRRADQRHHHGAA